MNIVPVICFGGEIIKVSTCNIYFHEEIHSSR